MAKPARKLGTLTVLSLFLMAVCTMWLASQCFSLQQKNSALSAEVQRLKASQVLLMVPEDQAKPIADWLATHPDETQSLLDRVHPSAAPLSPVTVDGAKQAQDSAPNATTSLQHANATAGEEPMNALVTTDLAQEKSQSGALRPTRVKIHADAAVNLDTTHPVIQTEDEPGIKVIVLPHGGIRVTTRDE